jgi:fibronectin type 3 domain-containing protein
VEGTEQMRLTLPALSADNQATGVQLSWKKNTAAETYEIYRSSYNGSTWTPWGKPIHTTTELNWLDTTAENGVRYRYTVRVRNGEFVSGYKDSATLTRLERVNVTSMVNNTSNITITWETNTAAAKYAVYRSALVDGAWSSWTRLTYVQKPNTQYVDYNVTNGVLYRYRIACVKGTEQSSARVSDNILRIGNTSITAAAYTGRVQLTIKANALAKAYEVERRTVIDGVKGEWETVVAETTELVNWDNTTEAGVTYEYRAVAINGTNRGYGKAASVTAK